MSLDDLSRSSESRRIRYGIVGLGYISQEMMQGFRQAGNSAITALVTGNAEKARLLGEKYEVANIRTYEEYSQLLGSGEVDAVYVATPNWRHAEFAVPALEAGIHVLLEKPMEVSADACLRIIEAQKASGAKLMIAYRLHFEPATIAAIETGRAGAVGKAHAYTATVGLRRDPARHRAQSGWNAGPVLDMGPYPINGARNLFEAEPTEVFAAGVRHPETGFDQTFDDTVSVTLRFPDHRIAQFTVSFYMNLIQTYTIIGTGGAVEVSPGFGYGRSMEHFITQGLQESQEIFKNTDHFGSQLQYFSQCILDGNNPEPDGFEGLADVRVTDAIKRSLESGRWEKIEPTEISRRISVDQVREFQAQGTPELINTKLPMLGFDR